MDSDTRYIIVKWRKRLERRGWHNARRFPVPHGGWIEYHAVWQGWLISGRCPIAGMDKGYWQPGSPAYLLKRMLEVEEAVWRPTTTERAGRIVRPLEHILVPLRRP